MKRRGLEVGDHVVCLPHQAWAVVTRAMALAGDSDWLFPATRKRRAGVEAKTVHPSQITHMFADLPGNPASPHDVRRAFATTYAEQADLLDEQVKWVLDHKEGIRSGDTTREHYRLTTGTHKKWPVARGWCDWVDRWAAAPL